MARAEDIARREPRPQPHPQHISMQVTDFPRDLLQRFINGNQLAHKNNLQNREETEEIELSLGLSLNGRFGVDPKRASKLSRSSSIPDFLNPFAKDNNNNDTPFMVPMACANLIRTCSLPTETEDDWRRRKELQTLRRMEAKRKRSEKQRNLKISRERSRVFGEENIGEDDKKEERDGTANGIYQVDNCVSFGVPAWVNGGKGPCGIAAKGGAAVDGDLPPVAPSAGAASQGSIGSSQGSGSSGFSEFDNQQPQGLNKCTEAVSPSSVQSTSKSEQKSPTKPEATIAERSGKIVRVPVKSESSKVAIAEKKVKEVMRNVLEDMPCVSTKGDGPNGKRIEGFLYRYRKGEEVRIVCVCHGSFLTPAEFVKHAGGDEVTHPLKHIVVNPSSLL